MDNIKEVIIKYRKPITFAFVGVINTGVDFSMFSLVLFFTPVNVLVAQAVGYTAGILCSFFLNKYVTFKNRTKSVKQALLFLLVNVVTMLISVIAIYFFHVLMGIQEHLAKLFLIAPITMVLNYSGYRYIVFVEKVVLQDIRSVKM